MNKLATNLTLTCRAETRPDRLRLTYAVTSKREEEVYLLDFLPFFPMSDLKTKKAVPDFGRPEVRRAGPGKAHLNKGIPPLPRGRLVNLRIMPLGTKLPPGQTVERTFDLPLPLREVSPYDGGDENVAYEPTKVIRLRLTLHVLSSQVEGFEAEPVASMPDFFLVRGNDTAGQAEELACEMDVPGLPFLQRKDWTSPA